MVNEFSSDLKTIELATSVVIFGLLTSESLTAILIKLKIFCTWWFNYKFKGSVSKKTNIV